METKFVFVIIGALTISMSAQASAIVDSSWGRTQQTLGGASNPNFVIPESLGKLSGSNLFHSFSKFNIDNRESATFTTSTSSIKNVITRISGKEPSTINGLLRLQAAQGSSPDFFFINPNGVTFGAGTQIDVPGAFHVSTANNLRFADGTLFSAGTGPDNVLTVAAPESFGFLGGEHSAAAVRFVELSKTPIMTRGTGYTVEDYLNFADSSRDYSPQNLLMFLGTAFDVVAGAIEVKQSNIASSFSPMRLSAVGNQGINIGLGMRSESNLQGTITIQSSDVSGSAIGHAVYIQGGEVKIIDASITNTTILPLAEQLNMVSDERSLHIDAQKLIIDKSSINASAYFYGKGGSLLLNVADSIYITHSDISSSGTSMNYPAEKSSRLIVGNIEISAPYIKIDKKSSIYYDAVAWDKTSTVEFGTVILRANNAIDIGGDSWVNASSIGGFPHLGYLPSNAPEIRIITPKLRITENSQIDASTIGFSNGGNIVIQSPTNSVGGLVPLDIVSDGSGWIATRTLGVGNAGSIEIAGSGVTAIGVRIDSTSFFPNAPIWDTYTPLNNIGNAGRISIATKGTIQLGPGTIITTNTTSGGNGGAIDIQGGSISMDNATITSGTFADGGGKAGSINLKTPGNISLVNNSLVSTNTRGSGTGGMINMSGMNIFLDNSGIESKANAGATGSSGNIDINTDHNLVLRNSTIATTANNNNGGFINIESENAVWLKDSKLTTSVDGDTGNGGDITIGTKTIVLEHGFIQANTAAEKAKGGTVTIDAQAIVGSGNNVQVGKDTLLTLADTPRDVNVIQSAAPNGVSGAIDLSRPSVDLANRISPQQVALIDIGLLPHDLCRLGSRSSLTQMGRSAGLLASSNASGTRVPLNKQWLVKSTVIDGIPCNGISM